MDPSSSHSAHNSKVQGTNWTFNPTQAVQGAEERKEELTPHCSLPISPHCNEIHRVHSHCLAQPSPGDPRWGWARMGRLEERGAQRQWM